MGRYSFTEFAETVDTLLGENGCPWDKSQTFKSLRSDLLEECYEAVEAINNNDAESLAEELGDVLLSVMLYAKIAEKDGLFTIDGVVDGICEKIIRRHAHVFGDKKAATADEALVSWEAEKKLEKGYASDAERLKAVPITLPALMRAQKVLKRAGVTGSDGDAALYSECVSRTAGDIAQAVKSGGDLSGPVEKALFYLAGLSETAKINAEFSLTNAIETYINVFENAENAATTAFDGIKPNFFKEDAPNEQN